jgi:hypothetical protein
MERPIFLIGAARSGTKIIGVTLAAHPQVAFWDEPKYVWREGRHGAPDDVRRPEEATPRVADAIRHRFDEFLGRSGRPRFLEKTPSNCFRVAFMHRIYPDGLFLHVRRDGRDVAASALRRWCSKPDDRAILRRFRGWEIPLSATHHYLPDILRELVFRRLHPGRGYVWGPRYPGLRQDLARGLDVATVCARQWAESEETAPRELAQLPPAQVHRFRYEDFVQRRPEVLAGILAFCRLPPDIALDRALAALRAESVGAWRSLPADQRRSVEGVCNPVMERLGMTQP